ncbi:hypothetical protein [Symbiopectobacterium sp. RP]|uniref:hypothetical protein n=1 Tax=Symbiopectobacterium sp. RP TaxID=3248553 RepID=UPI003D2AD241
MITANALICGKKIQPIVIKIMSLGYKGHSLVHGDGAQDRCSDGGYLPLVNEFVA